jgi:hypothetical protein
MENEMLYRRAAARVEARLAFYRHVLIYVLVNAFLAILNLIRTPIITGLNGRYLVGELVWSHTG